jgi:hypothetical protein
MNQVRKAKGWPLSQDELKASKELLISEISFVAVAEKYSSGIEDIGSSSFTHKCICPNPRHKNGGERTPSFYFSEEDKSFRCFGCTISGDIFDLIALMEGMPWGTVVRKLISKKNIDTNDLNIDFAATKTASLQQYTFDINLKISTALRKHLENCAGTDSYLKEEEWTDLMFKKIDSRLDKLENGSKESVKELELYVLMELERRTQQLSR